MTKKSTTAKAKEIAKKALEVEVKPEPVIAKFQLKTITWKMNAIAWHINLSINTTLSRAFMHYKAKFEFDDAPFLRKIEGINYEIKKAESESQLFEEHKNEHVASLKEEREEAEAEMEAMRTECEDIEFDATIVKVDWSGQMPGVEFAVDDNLIEKLNRKKASIQNYRIVLEPVK